MDIIVFGTHLSKDHGNTINEIEEYKFPNIIKIPTPYENDSPESISKNISKTISIFSGFWSNSSYDLIFCLGDRYEMFASVVSAIPFNLNFCHLHAGETTLGAIDNKFRHNISINSKYLFVSTETFQERACELSESVNNVFNVGALSVENILSEKLYDILEINQRIGIDLNKPTILFTFHPETVKFQDNIKHVREILKTFEILKSSYQILCTTPNTDTFGDIIAKELITYSNINSEIFVFKSLGMRLYLSCLKYSSFMLGNSSSGFVEGCCFSKPVINLGNRQEGRILTENIIQTEIKKKKILDAVKKIENFDSLQTKQIYGDGNTSYKIVQIILKILKHKT